MRGDESDQGPMFSYISAAQRVPADHPLRRIRDMADAALKALWPTFEGLYSKVGRPSIPPERLLRASLLQYFYGIRSERLLMEQLDYNLLFRWFVGLSMDDEVWDASTFSKNRERLLEGDVAQKFLKAVLDQAQEAGLTSDEHFSIDGTLVEAWASQKSFKPKDGSGEGGPQSRNPHVDFRGKPRKNDTHQSTTDPDARLYRKGDGQESKLSYLGHVVMENRHGLVVGCEVTLADGYGERAAGRALMSRIPRQPRVTLGADKGYDSADFIAEMRAQGVTPHVAQNQSRRRSAIDARTTRHPGYRLSQILRKAVEHPFGWFKAAAGMWQVKVRGQARVGWAFTFGMAAFNLIRMRRLLPNPC
ncbi:MAG TPA: IS5 family transposase [Vicinamibacteria bacterium]|nr:IS5 family transposase [Vicinamibacteria bacterium]